MALDLSNGSNFFLKFVECERLGFFSLFFLKELYFYQTTGVKLLSVKPRFFNVILHIPAIAGMIKGRTSFW